MCDINWLKFTSLGDFGGFIGGMATLGALLFAIRQVDTWKQQQRKVKRAETASDLIISSKTLNDFLGRISNLSMKIMFEAFSPDGEGGKDALEGVKELYRKTKELYRSEIKDFQVALKAAEVHLEDGEFSEATDLFNRYRETDKGIFSLLRDADAKCTSGTGFLTEEQRKEIFEFVFGYSEGIRGQVDKSISEQLKNIAKLH